MDKLNPSYELSGIREASLDALISEQPRVQFTPEFEKAKKACLRLSTFTILMASFNITSPLTIKTGIAEISIGDLKLFFILIILYQAYNIYCLKCEHQLGLLYGIEPLKSTFLHYLASRKAAISFRSKGVATTADFSMHGIEVGSEMLHTPAFIYSFKSPTERERWRKLIAPEFVIDDFLTTQGQRIYLQNSSITKEDLEYWHNNKKRLYIKTKPVIIHFHIPLIYSLVGLAATATIIFPSLKSWIG